MNDAPNTPPAGTAPPERPAQDAEATLDAAAEATFTAEGGADVPAPPAEGPVVGAGSDAAGDAEAAATGEPASDAPVAPEPATEAPPEASAPATTPQPADAEPEASRDASAEAERSSVTVEVVPDTVALDVVDDAADAPESSETAAITAAPQAAAVEAAPERVAVDAAPEPSALEASPATASGEPTPETLAEPTAESVAPESAAPADSAPEDSAPETPAEPAEPVATEVTAPEGSAPEAPSSEVGGSDSVTPNPDAGDSAASADSTPAAPAPKPAPRPSPAALAGLSRPAPPRPVATTGPPADATTEVAEPPAAPPSDSHRFGRVEDDGTVHVLLADGTEHAVGQYAAGTPDEGLAFYVRKYDDLSVEVDLAARRLAQGKAAPEQAAAVVKRARESLESPSMVGDLASLSARVDALDALVGEKRAAAAELRAAAKAAALAAREAIVLEAEKLAESTQWKATGDRFKALLDDWKAAPRADRTSEQALWKRFSHARSQFDKHRRQYFARLDGERSEAKQVKEALVAEAESLQGSTDWGATAGAYRDLMARWKASGRASKADEDALWSRFRAAQDAFFSGRNAALGERDAGFAENLAAKQALLVEAEAIDTSDLKGAKAALRGIQERWEKIGHVPRGDKERIEARLRKVEEKVRHGEQEQWRRSNPEAKARADATVAQFSTSLEKLEKERDKATAAGDARKAEDIDTRITTTKALLEAAERAAEEFSG